MARMFCRPFRSFLLPWVAVAVALSAGTLSAARKTPSVPPSYFARTFTTDQDLPKNRIDCLEQTHDGYLWAGTSDGLVRYDGARFTLFDHVNTPALTNDTITALAETADRTLWIGTLDGLVSYRDNKFTRFTVADGLPDTKIVRLSASETGVWIAAGEYVVRFGNGHFGQVWQPRVGHRVKTMQVAEDHSLNLFFDFGWLAISPGAPEIRTNYLAPIFAPPGEASTNYLGESSNSNWLAGVLARDQSNSWVVTRQGLFHVNGQQAIKLDPPGKRGLEFVYVDLSGNLWVNSRPGWLFFWDQQRWEEIDLNGAGIAVCMEEDQDGTLWVGTSRGLVQLQRRRVRTYTASGDYLPDDDIVSVCEGAPGEIWVGTKNKGLARIRNGVIEPLGNGRPEPPGQDRCVWPAPDGGVYILKPNVGILEFREREFLHRVTASSLALFPDVLYGDRSHRLWIGGNTGVKTFLQGDFSSAITNIAPTNLTDVHAVLEDRKGTLWFGTKDHGLMKVPRPGKPKIFQTSDGLSNNSVWAIHEDETEEGVLWIATANGLTRFKDGKFFAFKQEHGLREATVNCVLEDDSQHLWISGLRGIYRLRMDELNEVANTNGPGPIQCIALGTADGMEAAETNGGENQPAGCKASDGRLWFPTVKGVVVIDPKTIGLDEKPPQVLIEQVKANRKPVFGDVFGPETETNSKAAVKSVPLGSSNGGNLKIEPGGAHLVEFRYTANTLINGLRSRFRYRLRPLEKDYRQDTFERTAPYVNLSPGDYVFDVIAANQHNVWTPEPASLALTVAPYFWETPWFYVLVIVALITLAVGVQAYRLHWQHRVLHLEHESAMARERTRIARDLHDDLGTALTGLALELDVVGRDARSLPPLFARLSQAATRARAMAERMREVVWTVNPNCDNISSLADFLEQQVGQFLRADTVRVHLDFPDNFPDIPIGADARHQLALSVREALTNVVRHAEASDVTLSIRLEGSNLVIQVADNGRGFESNGKTGNGLSNMRARLLHIGGSFECVSHSGGGTKVTLRVPIPKPKHPGKPTSQT